MDIEGFKPIAEDGDLRSELVKGGEEGTEEGDHRGLAKRDPFNVPSVNDREQVGGEVRGAFPGVGNEVDEALDHLIFGRGSHHSTIVV